MADLTLAAAGALDEAAPAPRPARPGATSVMPLNGLAIAAVVARRGQGEALAARVREAFGFALPDGPRRAEGPRAAAIGTAPGAWLFSARASDPRWAEGLAGELRGLASVADQSDAYAAVRLAGPRAQAILSRALPIDLHDRAFPVGAGAVTAAAHLGLVLWRREPEVYELLSFRSHAGDFWRWLMDIGTAFGLEAMAEG